MAISNMYNIKKKKTPRLKIGRRDIDKDKLNNVFAGHLNKQ